MTKRLERNVSNGNPMPQSQPGLAAGSSYDSPLEKTLTLVVENAIDVDSSSTSNSEILAENGNVLLPKPTSEVEKEKMLEAGIAAKDELLLLINTDLPLWIRSCSYYQRLVLHSENYEQFFPRANHFKNPKPRVEASKDSRIVRMKPMDLVNMLLDSV